MGQVKFFKGCLPEILLGPFLDILPHLRVLLLITSLVFNVNQAVCIANRTHRFW